MAAESDDSFQPGRAVKIVSCPLNNQHRGMVGAVIENHGHVLCVELPDGSRCWTARVEPAEGDAAAKGG